MPLVILTDNDENRTVKVRQGGIVEVRLSENATTGYRWDPDSDVGEFVDIVSTRREYPKTSVGSAGVVIFSVEALKPGHATLSFRYWRHWEGDRSIAKRYRVDLEIQS